MYSELGRVGAGAVMAYLTKITWYFTIYTCVSAERRFTSVANTLSYTDVCNIVPALRTF